MLVLLAVRARHTVARQGWYTEGMKVACGVGWPDIAHGSRSHYVNSRCRCSLCRAANAAYMRELRESLSARTKAAARKEALRQAMKTAVRNEALQRALEVS